jgi:hypothetical protein
LNIGRDTCCSKRFRSFIHPLQASSGTVQATTTSFQVSFYIHSFIHGPIFRRYMDSAVKKHTHKKLRVNSSTSWEITPHSMLKLNRRFGGTCPLHLQAGRSEWFSLMFLPYLTFCNEVQDFIVCRSKFCSSLSSSLTK